MGGAGYYGNGQMSYTGKVGEYSNLSQAYVNGNKGGELIGQYNVTIYSTGGFGGGGAGSGKSR